MTEPRPEYLPNVSAEELDEFSIDVLFPAVEAAVNEQFPGIWEDGSDSRLRGTPIDD